MRTSFISRRFLNFLQLLSCCALIACGGGGGGNKAPDTSSIASSSTTSSKSSAGSSSSVAPDTTPDAFSFTTQTDAAVNTEYLSNTITVKGIDTAVPVTISGGSYSINGGEFTSAAGTVSADQTITVKTTSGNATETSNEAVLTIGGVSGTFTVTTVGDTTPPVAEFKFPTPYTMSEANEVKVRGTATDDHAITDVKLVVRSFNLATPDVTISTTDVPAIPKSTIDGVNDFSSWTATIPLTANAENEIKVIATDDRNNSIEISEANKIVIRQAPVASAFPDEANQFGDLSHSAIDNKDDHNRIFISDRGKIWSVDVSTGLRNLFIDHQSMCNGISYGLTIDHQSSRIYGACNMELYEFNLETKSFVNKYTINPNLNSHSFLGMVLDRNNGRNQLVLVESTYEYNENNGVVIGFSLDLKEFSVLSTSEQSLLKGSFGGIVVSGDNYLITSGGQHEDANMHKIISVNAMNGNQTVYADNTTGSGEFFSALLPNGNTAALTGMTINSKANMIITIEALSSRLLSIDMQTGNRSLFKDASYLAGNSTHLSSMDIDFDEDNGYVIVTDQQRDAIILIDIETSEKIILSKFKNNN